MDRKIIYHFIILCKIIVCGIGHTVLSQLSVPVINIKPLIDAYTDDDNYDYQSPETMEVISEIDSALCSYGLFVVTGAEDVDLFASAFQGFKIKMLIKNMSY